MIVAALGGISAHKGIGGVEGWWGELAGPGKALDPEQIRLVGMDWLESSDDQIATTVDQADHLARTLDLDRIERLDLLIGSSFGGNVALCFAAKHPERSAAW